MKTATDDVVRRENRHWRRKLRLSPLWFALVVCLLNVQQFQNQHPDQFIPVLRNETFMKEEASSSVNSWKESDQHQQDQERRIVSKLEPGSDIRNTRRPTLAPIAALQHVDKVQVAWNKTWAPTPTKSKVTMQHHKPLSKVEKIIQMLQKEASSTNSFRYYVYDHPEITRMDVRAKAQAGNFTWRKKWGHRLKDFALWELRYLEALERNTTFRTYNVSQADFIVIPIPLCALITAGFKRKTRATLDALYAQTIFQSMKEKHVFFTFADQLFHPKSGVEFVMNQTDYEQFRHVSVASVEDTPIWGRIPQSTKDKGYWNHTLPGLRDQPIRSRIYINHGFSIQYMGAATDPEHQRVILNKTAFDQKRHYFFYHTIHGKSIMNSTQFRHAPTRPHVVTQLLQPSSVGYNVPAHEWLSQFQDSKFCLVIRGDNPVSRSLWRAIKNGCIPVIVSNAMPYWAPIFRSMLDLSDYAVLVDEMEFLQNPAQALNQAITSLTNDDIEQKIAGLNLVQRLILPDEADSLFVAAFAHETLASRTREYYNVTVKLYGDEHQVSLTF